MDIVEHLLVRDGQCHKITKSAASCIFSLLDDNFPALHFPLEK